MSLSQNQICQCFNEVFERGYRVRLLGGGLEPDYLPGGSEELAVIVAREDFAASALHEAAHWCVASRRRRALPDYGYSYSPPPRSAAGQSAFFAAEQRVQAVEWYLARRAGIEFRASGDDPDLPHKVLERFQAQLWPQVQSWESRCSLPSSLPERARTFGRALEQLAALGTAAI